MNIYTKEFKDTFKSLIIWSLSIALFIYIAMMKFKGYQGNAELVTEFLGSFPKPLMAALGFGELDISTIPGYYSAMYIYFLMIAGIHAAMLGGHTLAKEEIEKTSEFLLPKPISRAKIISYKLLAGLSTILLLNIFMAITNIIFVNMNNEGSSITREIIILNILMFLLQVMFLLLGTAISAITKNSKISGAVATGIIVSTYFLSVLIGLNNKLKPLVYLTPFKYFNAETIFLGKSYDLIYFIITFGVITIFTIATYYFYNKKDISL